MRTQLAFCFLLVGTVATAQTVPAAQSFVPFTVTAETYQAIDADIARIPMPREAHAAWIAVWRGLEDKARADAARKVEPSHDTGAAPSHPPN